MQSRVCSTTHFIVSTTAQRETDIFPISLTLTAWPAIALQWDGIVLSEKLRLTGEESKVARGFVVERPYL